MDLESRYKNLPSQALYGQLLGVLVNIGIGLLVLTFGISLSGALDPLIAMDQLPQFWGLPLQEFLLQTGAPIGWGWVDYLGKGDYLMILPIVFLASVSLIGYTVILFFYQEEKNRTLVIMILTELSLILFAASDILSSGTG